MKLTHVPVRKGRIEIVPLVDLIFLLLVSFMYSYIQLDVSRGFRVDLPQASFGKTSREEAMTVSVAEGGAIWLDQEQVSLEELVGQLEAKRQGDPKVRVVLRADRQVRHGEVVRVLDACHRAGVEKIAIHTRPLDEVQP